MKRIKKGKELKKIKKKWCCRRGDESHVRELSFATLATFKQKGNFLEGTHKIPFHPYFYYFISKKKKLLNLCHSFISSFTWALVSNYLPIVLLEYLCYMNS